MELPEGRKQPSDAAVSYANDIINSLLDKGSPVYEFSLNRKEAEALYGETMYDHPELCTDLGETLPLVYIEECIIHASNVSHVSSTALIGKINLKVSIFSAVC